MADSFDWMQAMKAIGPQQGQGQSQDQVKSTAPTIANASAGQSQSPLGTPRAPVSMDALMKLLSDHADLYMRAAMSPGGGAPQQQRPPGLLGF